MSVSASAVLCLHCIYLLATGKQRTLDNAELRFDHTSPPGQNRYFGSSAVNMRGEGSLNTTWHFRLSHALI